MPAPLTHIDRRRRALRAGGLIATALAAAAAAGCGGEDARPPTPSPAQFVRCESPAGFTLARPRGWHTNPGDVAPRCSRLDPDPIELREGTDARAAAIVARIEDVRFGRVAAPREDAEVSRAVTTIDGLRAVRLELELSRPGLWPRGTPVTRYLVDLSPEPGTLILDTVGLDGFDYERNQTVLDDVARRLDVTRDGVRTAPRVVARYGGKGAFRVVGTLRDGRPCLRIPPDGSKRCLDSPPAGGGQVALTRLRPMLAGVAAPDVFRVTAVRRGSGTLSVLPAPIGDSRMRGFAFPFGPQGVRRLLLFGDDGERLGTLAPPAPARPRRTGRRKGAGTATARQRSRLTGVRTARHAKYDRVALDFAAGTGGARLSRRLCRSTAPAARHGWRREDGRQPPPADTATTCRPQRPAR